MDITIGCSRANFMGSGTFRPKTISSPRRLASRTFRPWSFRPYWTFRPLDVSPPKFQLVVVVVGGGGGGGGAVNVEIYVHYILNYTSFGNINHRSVIVNYTNYYSLIIRSCT